jgi:hypothetical protein
MHTTVICLSCFGIFLIFISRNALASSQQSPIGHGSPVITIDHTDVKDTGSRRNLRKEGSYWAPTAIKIK